LQHFKLASACLLECIRLGGLRKTYSGYKVLIQEGTDRILGAHILGSEAGEVINLFALFAYPTSGSNTTRML
jgi:glutathione reductase (NADPH)